MRILLLGFSHRIGLTFHYTRLAVALKRAGNDVVVISTNNAQYDRLSEDLKNTKVRLYSDNSMDKTNLIDTVKALKFLKSVLKKEKSFDLIVGGGVRESIKVWLSSRKLNEKPITFSVVGSLPQIKFERFLAGLFYNLFYDNCIALCKYTKNQLKDLGINTQKIHVIPLFAPDLTWFDKAKISKIDLKDYDLQDLDKSTVFYAASHYCHKGFEYYLMAASEVLKKFDATFIVGGKGPLTEYLKKLADKLEISKNVIFTGWISNYHIPYILSNLVDICVSTSLVEQLPSYLMECMAAKKPIIATCVGGVPEIVINGLNGYLIPPADPQKTADYIMYLIENLKKARDMGIAGRKIVENQLNMQTSINKLLKIYEMVT